MIQPRRLNLIRQHIGLEIFGKNYATNYDESNYIDLEFNVLKNIETELLIYS